MGDDLRVAYRLVFLKYGTPYEFVLDKYVHHRRKRRYNGETKLVQVFAEDILFYETLPGSLHGMPPLYILDVNEICMKTVADLRKRCVMFKISFADLVNFVYENKKSFL